MSALGCVVRGNYFDERVKLFIGEHEHPVVVNVGCGLDTRFQRIENRGNAMFYELDLPEVMDIRQQLIPEPSGDYYISGSILNTDWMDKLKQQHPDGEFIFVIEGVLMYFYEKQVWTILKNIADRFPGGEIAFDVCGSMMVKTNLKPDSLRESEAQIRNGINCGHEVERQLPGLELIEQCIYQNFAKNRWRFGGYILRMFPAFSCKFSSLMTFRIKCSVAK